MRKVKFVLVLVLLALLFGAGIIKAVGQESPLIQESVPAIATPQPQSEDLQPGVKDFIADNYLSHTSQYPDPNEPVEVLRLYLEGRQLLRQGDIEQAISLFSETEDSYSECRHAHAGLGDAFWQRYASSGDKDDLITAIEHYLQAAHIGFKYGRVRYTGRIAKGLGWLGDAEALREFFQQALQVGDSPYLTRLDYAQGFALIGDAQAEEWYKKAIDIQAEGNIDALAFYAEWLLEEGREEDVLQVIDPDAHVQALHFLRGVALEQLGRIEEATKEYAQFVEFSKDFPAPAKYRIEGSEAQEGVLFEGNEGRGKGLQARLLISGSQARHGLSYLIYGEAPEETEGGMRAVGWTVRTRVFKGGAPVGYCVGAPSGSTIPDKYKSVICSGEFDGSCDAWCSDPSQGCSYNWTSDHVAYDVYYGLAPDPVTWWCPAGTFDWSPCWSSVHCSQSSVDGARTDGPIAFHGLSQCPSSPAPFSCSTNVGTTCGNGYPDNCFYHKTQ